ncbi:MAG: FHA domain-containing protein [Verrucomicrobiota bacterium]
MPKLLIKSEGGARVPHELAEELITVGRGPDNAIRLDHPSVSGRHAQLQRVGDIYRLKDLDSTNGTQVNGQKINETALRFGDRIRFGKIEALFESDVSEQAQPLPELREVEARPAESSARPADFANASPFPNRKKDRDPIRQVILAAAGIALLAFVGSMIAVLMMRAPV